MTRPSRLSVWVLAGGFLAFSPTVEGAPDIAELRRDVSAIRGLAFKRDFTASAIDREGLGKILAEEIDHELPSAKEKATTRVYALLGLVPEGFDMRRSLREVLTLGVGGIYIPRRGGLWHLSDLAGMAGPILAHEIQHALQDQHWPITERDGARAADSDRVLAYHAILEGDAMAVMAEYAKRNPGSAKLSPEELGQQFVGSFGMAEYPAILSEPMTMPYIQGQRFVERVRARGGWEAVNALLDRPPESSEQILHPEKFFAGDDPPRAVALPDLAAVLGAGWKKTEEDTFGEWMVTVAVRILTEDAVRGARAGAGWGGDRFALYEDGQGGAVLAWGSVWDTEKDAAEFEEALAAAFARRAPVGAPCHARRTGNAVLACVGGIDAARFDAAVKLFEKQLTVK